MSRLEVVELRKSYGSVCVVDGVSFTVASGEIFGLLGPNGAGKTTTMSMIAGLLEADSGEVRFDDRPIKSFTKQDRRFLGIAPQDLAIYPELSARENLEFFGKLYGLCGMELKKRLWRSARSDRVVRACRSRQRPLLRRDEAATEFRSRTDSPAAVVDPR